MCAHVPAMEGLEPRLLLSAVGDFVWDDLNANGIQDVGEPGLADATVQLYASDDTLLGTTTTDATGHYLFDTLAPGDYYLQFIALQFSPANVGGNPALDSDVNPATGRTAIFTLGVGQTDTGRDAGEYQLASAGGLVWDDLNADGVQDPGEPGVPDVAVQLYDSSDSVVATTTTDDFGGYVFDGLVPGSYYLQFTGIHFSPANSSGDLSLLSDVDPVTGRTATFTLASGQSDTGWDAGTYQLASVGDFVWDDMNDNGIQDRGEPGLPDVVVQLYDSTDTLAGTTTTDEFGNYLFDSLVPGSYYLQFTGIQFSPANVGDPARDSDPDPDTGRTATFTLISAQVDPTWDAGIFTGTAVTIGTGHASRLVFTDADGTAVTVGLSRCVATITMAGDNIAATTSEGIETITGENLSLASVDVTASTVGSALSFTTRGGTIPGATLGSITGSHPLGAINGATMDLVGGGIVMTGEGYVRTINLHGLVDGAEIVMPTLGGSVSITLGGASGGGLIQLGSPSKPGTFADMNLGQVADLSVNSQAPLRNVRALEWLNTDGQADLLAAPSLSTLYVTGRRANPRLGQPVLAGDFQANLALTNAASQLNTVSVAGSLGGADWQIAGPVGAISVGQWVRNSAIRATGSVRSLITGAMQGSTLYVGVKAAVAGTPQGREDFLDVPDAKLPGIQTFTVRGLAAQPSSMIDSIVAAWTIRAASIKDVQASGPGTCALVGHMVSSFRQTQGTVVRVSTKLIGPATIDELGGFQVILF